MKTTRWLVLVILAAGMVGLTACHRQKPPTKAALELSDEISAVRDSLPDFEKAFAGNPLNRSAVNISMSVNHGEYSAALNGLQALAGNPRLTAPQQAAVATLTDAVNQMMAKIAAAAAAPKTP